MIRAFRSTVVAAALLATGAVSTLLVSASVSRPAVAAAAATNAVVYHVNDARAQALGGLRNVRNHLDTDPDAKITVVAHGEGVDFLMEGAKDRNGNTYDQLVAGLVARGVRFEVCEITLKNRNLKREQFVQEAEFTPSGVVRIARLQQQGYAYIRP